MEQHAFLPAPANAWRCRWLGWIRRPRSSSALASNSFRLAMRFAGRGCNGVRCQWLSPLRVVRRPHPGPRR